jgi:uncharacterized protein (TIGR03118 family)
MLRRFRGRQTIATRVARPSGLSQLESLEERCLPSGAAYLQTNLVADTAGAAARTDSHLVDAWGLAIGNGNFLVANAGSSTATVYNSSGAPQTNNVITTPAQPTGAVFNSSGTGFNVSQGSLSSSSEFLIATLGGQIAGWAPAINATAAIVAVNNAPAYYTGLAMASTSSGALLYAADYRGDKVDVYTSTFQPTLAGAFVDSQVPTGFAPFNIQNIGGKLYVTFARQNFAAAAGNGFVDVFDTNGHLLQRLTSGGNLNLPWGLALAPTSFGQYAGDLLVGNFGDGRINAYDAGSGTFVGPLHDNQDNVIAINGLWSLQFGTGGAGGNTNSLYFTAGPSGGQHGLFGTLALIPGVYFQTLSAVTTGTTTTTYAISIGNTLYQHTDSGGWTALGQGILSVSAVTEKSGNIVVFVETLDHALFRYTSAGGWQPIGATGTVYSISGGVDTSGVAVVWVIAADTAMSEYKDASGWVGNIGGAGTILQMSATANNHVIVVTTDNSVYEHDDVFGWFALSSSSFATALSAVTDTQGNLVVFAVGTDKSLGRYDNATGWSVQGGPGTIESVAGGTDASGSVDVYVITSGGAFSELNNQFGWRILGAPGTILYYSPTGGDRVIVVAADHAVSEFDDTFGWLPLTSSGFAKG